MIETTMVERVARAIHAVVQQYTPPAAGYAGPGWRSYEREARAAIAAMREPTEEMSAAGTSSLGDLFGAAAYPHTSDARDIWRAMIDSALSSSAPGKEGENE